MSTLDNDRQELMTRQEMNLVVGAATTLMTSLGMDWNEEVAPLCNFSGPWAETKRRWDMAMEKAVKEISALRRARHEARRILWMAREYAEAGGSGGPEMRDYAEASELIGE